MFTMNTVTLVTAKKRKRQYIRAYARAREGDYEDFHNFFLFILLCSIETTLRFMKNHTSFDAKPHVVL